MMIESKRGQWPMLAVLLVGQFMGLLDVFVVNVSMPEIGTGLHASGAYLQLVVGGYTVAYAMLLITGARLGDLYGRRWMYLLGVIVFTLSSLACGLAPDIGVLVGFRFVQGAGAALMVPQIMSVIQLRFTGPARAKALSAYGAVLSTGAVAGLVLGGVIVNADLFGSSWRPVFLINVPVGAVLVALVPRLVPVDVPRGLRRLDVAGLAIVSAAVSLIVLPLVLGHELGWPWWTFGCIAAGLVLGGGFVPFERRMAARGGDPLVNLDVLRAPGLGSGLTTLACQQVAYGGFLFVFTLHLQAGLGDGALRTGLTYIPMGATFGLLGYHWRRLPAKVHYVLAPAGMGMCVLAYLGFGETLLAGQGSPLMWASMVVVGAGMGLSVSPLLAQSLVAVAPSQAADASGLLTTVVQLSQVVGVAGVGTVFLSLDHPAGRHASSAAMSTTAYWLALLSLAGLVAATVLARTTLRAARPVAPPVPAPAARFAR
jgi:MFS family permease